MRMWSGCYASDAPRQHSRGQNAGQFLDEFSLLKGICLTWDFRGLLICEAYAVQQVNCPLRSVGHAKGHAYSLRHTFGICIDMLTQYLCTKLHAVEFSPIALTMTLQQIIYTSRLVVANIAVYCCNADAQIFRY